MQSPRPFRFVSALALTTAIFLAAIYAPKVIRIPPGSFVPSSFVSHSLMLVLSILAMWLISKGRLGFFGFTTKTYTFSPHIFLWILPTAAIGIAQALALPHGQAPRTFIQLTNAQTVVFVWIYASLCEETLVRGLLQSLLGGLAEAGVAVRSKLSLPVVVSALAFGAMHLGLIGRIGAAAIPIILMTIFLGFVAAHYREKTGSLLPAILVHMFFNMGGTLPLWVLVWMRR